MLLFIVVLRCAVLCFTGEGTVLGVGQQVNDGLPMQSRMAPHAARGASDPAQGRIHSMK